MASSLSAETNTLDSADSFNPSEWHSETDTDEDTTDSEPQGVQLIAKKNTKLPVWNYFGFSPDEDGKPTNYCNPRCKLYCILKTYRQSLAIQINF